MSDKKIKLTEIERKRKEEQIEEYEMAIQGTELHISTLEKEIELDLPRRQAVIQSRKQLNQMKLNLSNYKKEKEIIEKQLKEWK